MGEAEVSARKDWLAVLARIPRARLQAALDTVGPVEAAWPRPATIGMVMLEGRAGGGGQRFSLGQATVTRATCRVGDATGVGYILGHDPERAEAMALADALLQGPGAAALREALLEPEAATQAAVREDRAKAAAATRVEFFTMARGGAGGGR